jgi:hypothetical protein
MAFARSPPFLKPAACCGVFKVAEIAFLSFTNFRVQDSLIDFKTGEV